MTSSNWSGGLGGGRGSATFSVNSFRLMPAVKNAPYSGQQVTETKQTLIDGTNITRQMPRNPKTWRDSQGRVRTENSLPGPGMQTQDGAAAIVQIHDPVAGYMYVIDNINHVAHRVTMNTSNDPSARFTRPGGASLQAASDPAVAFRTSVPTGAIASGVIGGIIGSVPAGMPPGAGNRQRPEITSEDLGTKMIDGVLTNGIRRTTIIPEGMQGNDRPMKNTSETWMSKELQLTLLSVDYSPMNGTTTTRYENFSAAEPDPALFMVPASYSIVDEKETFTIKWGEQQ